MNISHTLCKRIKRFQQKKKTMNISHTLLIIFIYLISFLLFTLAGTQAHEIYSHFLFLLFIYLYNFKKY